MERSGGGETAILCGSMKTRHGVLKMRDCYELYSEPRGSVGHCIPTDM
jgi:hypothetical protein